MPAGMPGCGLQSVAPDAAGAWLRSVPGRRPARLRNLHERMPVIMERSAWATWLGEDAAATGKLMRPATVDVLKLWPVLRAVNGVRNNGAMLLDVVTDPAAPPPSNASAEPNLA